MKTIQNHELEKLISAGKVIEKDTYGPKVILLSEDRYLKIFYQKSTVSMATIRSRAKQFSNNAKKLKTRGITTVGILDLFRTKNPRRDCVCYHGIPGDTIRQTLAQSIDKVTLCYKLGEYVAQLHDAGVMFRALHMGSIIQLTDGSFGLIDIDDMRVNVFSLHRSQRQRNFQHLFRYQQDRDAIDLDAFEQGYLSSCPARQHKFYRQALASAQPQI